MQFSVSEGMVFFHTSYYGFKFGEVGNFHTAMGWGSTVIYPITLNHETWADLPESIRPIITEVIAVYVQAVEEEAVSKFETALDNLRTQGVKVKDIDPEEQEKTAQAIEPPGQQQVRRVHRAGRPGRGTLPAPDRDRPEEGCGAGLGRRHQISIC